MYSFMFSSSGVVITLTSSLFLAPAVRCWCNPITFWGVSRCLKLQLGCCKQSMVSSAHSSIQASLPQRSARHSGPVVFCNQRAALLVKLGRSKSTLHTSQGTFLSFLGTQGHARIVSNWSPRCLERRRAQIPLFPVHVHPVGWLPG